MTLSSAFFFAYGKIRFVAPVAQWIEYWPPKPRTAVRVCAGAPEKTAYDGGFLFRPVYPILPHIFLGYNRPVRYSITFLLVLSLAFLTGCGVNFAAENATSTPVFITATLPATIIPLPTQTLLPPTPPPTIPPIDGTTTTQVNVRAETSTASDALGTISQFSKVQIIGRDTSGSWYQIVYAGAPNGTGWIRAEYVQVNAEAEIPVIEAVSGSGAEVSGLVIQKINVRGGPGTTYQTLGELNPNDVVFISGKDESGAWIQIEFANSADGKGWAALEFLKVENVDSLPVIGSASPTTEVAERVTPQANGSSSAMPDGDSQEAPLANINFSPLGARMAQISGSLSALQGDTEDWVQFRSYAQNIAIHLVCLDTALRVELISNGEVADSFLFACMENRLLDITANQINFLRLSEADTSKAGQTNYILVMESIQ